MAQGKRVASSKSGPPPTTTSSAHSSFIANFYQERAKFASHPASEIRGAGKPTRAAPNGEDELWWLKHGPEMVQRWEDWRDRTPWSIWVTPDGVPAIELELTEVYDGETLKVIIDRVFQTPHGTLIILDLKSGSRTPASALQLGFGAAVLNARFGVKVSGGTFWMARTGECEPIESLEQWTPALAAHYARQLQLARRHEIYLPHVTNLCRACGVRDYCFAVGGRKSYEDPDYELIGGNA